ncbi:PHB depolymerase family esterase [Lentzea alba]|uniref:extracellular catalytic domain type 1 short-chain-length polyhydroxyalkanoate depolymerase n=1 Tax=Lentzea alba TaxID=2714351 RepID=UPI0039BF725F
MKRNGIKALGAAVVALLGLVVAPQAAAATLTEVTNFGTNPSNLRMHLYRPDRVAAKPAVLLAVHYCGGSGQAFHSGTEFARLADQHGFVVIYPTVTRNSKCFDVSSPQALRRDGGSDPVGLMSMVRYVLQRHNGDPARVFVTGASSGAMMTNVMLANYPDVFSAGAAFAGVPAGCFATTNGSEWNSQCANGTLLRTPQQWGDIARSAYPGYTGKRPRVQLWHGTQDEILRYPNFGEEIDQWTNVHGLPPTPTSTDSPQPNWTRTRYGDRVEAISLQGTGHSLPAGGMALRAIQFFGLDTGQEAAALPNSFRWSSSGVLISPKPDATHANLAVKDPTVVFHNGRYHVFASTYTNGYNLVYLSFTDFSQAAAAPHHYLDRTAIGAGYRAAPQVFYFAPQRLWYLVYQTGAGGSYSTTTDISRPETWSAPRNFYSSMPQIIRDNIGNGYWVDFWNVCDSAKCYLFSADDNGHLYRSETTVGEFPNGFRNTVIAMQDANRYRLFEAPNVYKVGNQYLLLVEAIGTDGRRWFRSWTGPAITGPWTALADSEPNPFARANTTTFPSGQWTRDISHGELIRSGTDQAMEISPCRLRFLYQGLDPNAGGDYNRLPWRLGLLSQTNSAC